MSRIQRSGVVASAVLAVVVSGLAMGCSNLSSDVLRQLNPCLTIINCDPLAYEDLFLDLMGGVNLGIDPTCTMPRRCGSIFPPPAGTGEAEIQEATGGGGGGGGGLGGGGLGGGLGGGGLGGGGGFGGGGFGT